MMISSQGSDKQLGHTEFTVLVIIGLKEEKIYKAQSQVNYIIITGCNFSPCSWSGRHSFYLISLRVQFPTRFGAKHCCVAFKSD